MGRGVGRRQGRRQSIDERERGIEAIRGYCPRREAKDVSDPGVSEAPDAGMVLVGVVAVVFPHDHVDS